MRKLIFERIKSMDAIRKQRFGSFKALIEPQKLCHMFTNNYQKTKRVI